MAHGQGLAFGAMPSARPPQVRVKRPAIRATGEGAKGGELENKTLFTVCTGDKETSALVASLRKQISDDKRLAALEDHCFHKWDIKLAQGAFPLENRVKKRHQYYHKRAGETKSARVADRIGEPHYHTFFALLETVNDVILQAGNQDVSQSLITWMTSVIGEVVPTVDIMKVKHFSRVISKCEVTVTSKIIHVTIGWKAAMHDDMKQAVFRAMNTLGTAQHEPRAPMPVIKDYKEALAKLGEWGRQDADV